MKTVILAGGIGTRLAEETEVRPKPMIEVGGKPILWHIIKHYAYYDFKEFFVALGYKGEVIKRYFFEYYSLNGSITIDLSQDRVDWVEKKREDLIIHLMETGLNTNTGGRIKRLKPWLRSETFMATYGDGVCDVNLQDLLKFHKTQGRIATLTAVRPPARFGGVVFEGDLVVEFSEKPQIGEGWISGGFMVFEPAIFDYLKDDDTILESHALEQLARERQLAAFRHENFWQCMDTLRDKRMLESLWQQRKAPWRLWE